MTAQVPSSTIPQIAKAQASNFHFGEISPSPVQVTDSLGRQILNGPQGLELRNENNEFTIFLVVLGVTCIALGLAWCVYKRICCSQNSSPTSDAWVHEYQRESRL